MVPGPAVVPVPASAPKAEKKGGWLKWVVTVVAALMICIVVWITFCGGAKSKALKNINGLLGIVLILLALWMYISGSKGLPMWIIGICGLVMLGVTIWLMCSGILKFLKSESLLRWVITSVTGVICIAAIWMWISDI